RLPQRTSTPQPSGVSRPVPVTGTRPREIVPPGPAPPESAALIGVVDRALNGQDLPGRLARTFAAAPLLERHHQPARVQAVGAQIIDDAGVLGHLALIDAKMLDDDLLDALGSVAHRRFLICWPGLRTAPRPWLVTQSRQG